MARPRKIQTENTPVSNAEPVTLVQAPAPKYSSALVLGNYGASLRPEMPSAQMESVFFARDGWAITVPAPGVLSLERGELRTFLCNVPFQVVE